MTTRRGEPPTLSRIGLGMAARALVRAAKPADEPNDADFERVRTALASRGTHPSAIRLEALAVGDEDASAARHVAVCAACAAYIAKLRRHVEEFRRRPRQRTGRVGRERGFGGARGSDRAS
jgi:hypothetical protein